MKSAAFDVSDNDDSIPDEPSSVFSPGERDPGYTISITPRDEPDSDPLIPMKMTATRGTNIRQTTVRIFPEDGSQPTEILVSIAFSLDLHLVALERTEKNSKYTSGGSVSDLWNVY